MGGEHFYHDTFDNLAEARTIDDSLVKPIGSIGNCTILV